MDKPLILKEMGHMLINTLAQRKIRPVKGGLE
jgi:hypothetical protein